MGENIKPLGKSYEEYRINRENPNRKFSTENSFRKKIIHIINDTKVSNPKKGYAMDILFQCITVEQHKEFLYKHIEESSNIYKTINNIDKAKARSVSEILVLDDLKNIVDLEISDNGNKDKRAWDLIITISERDLTLKCSVRLNMVSEFTNIDSIRKTNNFDGDKSYLGSKYLNKQQYFMDTLKGSLNTLDETTIGLLMLNKK